MYNKMILIRYFAVLLLLCICAFSSFAQNRYRAQTLFILDIASEARSSGMGDVGVATSPDVMSQRWNASKYIFTALPHGVSVSYTPWLNKIAKGMNMGFISGYTRFDNSAIGVSATYLSIGGIELFDASGVSSGSISSEEYSIDASYSHRLGEFLSGGITLRYANGLKVESSGIPNGGVLRPSPAFAGDVAFFYTRPLAALGRETNLSFGTCISNLGTKVKLSGDEEILLPMNWRLGTSWDINIDKNNALVTSFDINKSLVPLTYEKNITTFEAIGKSFSEARDFIWSAGFEYSVFKAAMLRTGYRHSKNNKGYRYFTLGAGLVYQSLRLDASYLITTSNVSSPLSNTFRFTLSYLWK